MQKVTVQTAQNVTIDYPPASVGDRIGAYFIDGLILTGWALLWVVILNASQTTDQFGIVMLLLIGVPYFLYHLVCEVFFEGQSFGKQQMNIKVIALDGSRPSLGKYFIRWAFRLIDISLFWGVIAVVTVASSEKGQRLGDMVAGTSVIKLSKNKKRGITSEELFRAVEKDEAYTVQYPQARHLSDRDIQIIREALQRHRDTRQAVYLTATADRVAKVMGVQAPSEHHKEFLNRVVQDHIYLAQQSV